MELLIEILINLIRKRDYDPGLGDHWERIAAVCGSPLVTALIVTYNHEKYIASAIDSALMQETTFPFEVLISEDASIDNTPQIVREYARENPHLVRPIWSDRNVGPNEAVARGLRLARGRYVALLDGDDFWISKTKLQDEAEYLQVNPEVSAVFHNAVVAVESDVTERRWTRADQKGMLGLEDLWLGNPFAICAGMMRTACIRNVPSWYEGLITDWPLYVLSARVGRIAFIDEVVAVYRHHSGGLFSNLPQRLKDDAVEHFYTVMLSVVHPSERAAVRDGYSAYFFGWAKTYLKAGDIVSARSCFRRGVRGGGLRRSVFKRETLRLGAHLFKPNRHG